MGTIQIGGNIRIISIDYRQTISRQAIYQLKFSIDDGLNIAKSL